LSERIDISIIGALFFEAFEVVWREFFTISPYRDDSNKFGPHSACSGTNFVIQGFASFGDSNKSLGLANALQKPT
jgi:hypothetical protein